MTRFLQPMQSLWKDEDATMTADYADPLKRAWDLMRCPRRLVARPPNRIVAQPHCGPGKGYCKGHAALLEMVDGVHVPGCDCDKRHDVNPRCLSERRRLRAAVGVDDDNT